MKIYCPGCDKQVELDDVTFTMPSHTINPGVECSGTGLTIGEASEGLEVSEEDWPARPVARQAPTRR